jgi:hypothetical protein
MGSTSGLNGIGAKRLLALGWEEDRAAHYPHTKEILLTFACGGANAARSLRFKEDLVALSQRLRVRLRVAHYPPYTSQVAPDRASAVQPSRAQPERCHPRLAADGPAGHRAHAHPDRPHRQGAPSRGRLRTRPQTLRHLPYHQRQLHSPRCRPWQMELPDYQEDSASLRPC